MSRLQLQLLHVATNIVVNNMKVLWRTVTLVRVCMMSGRCDKVGGQ